MVLLKKIKTGFANVAYMLTKNKTRCSNLLWGMIFIQDLTSWHLLHRLMYSFIDINTLTHVITEIISFILFVYVLQEAGKESDLYYLEHIQNAPHEYGIIQREHEKTIQSQDLQALHQDQAHQLVIEKEINKD